MNRYYILALLFIVLSANRVVGQPRQRSMQVPGAIKGLLLKHSCSSCHHPDRKLVGPSFYEIAKRNYSREEIAKLIVKPKPDNWPQFPAMPVLENIGHEDATKISDWIASIQRE